MDYETQIMLDNAFNSFKELYGTIPTCGAWAPGRVNLIGEHTDYSDGWVMPIAIDKKIMALAKFREDRAIRAASLDFPGQREFVPGEKEKAGNWHDGLVGTAWLLSEKGDIPGADILFSGNVPIEAGVSSSAAFMVCCAYLLSGLAKIEITPKNAALFCRRIEHEFFGVKCGIMDQMASAAGRKGFAMLLDCRTLEIEDIPLPHNLTLILAHTGIRRSLAGSKYNERSEEVEQASKIIGVSFLRDARLEDLEKNKTELGDILYRRAKHVINENLRVHAAKEALVDGDLKTFGMLLNQSHDSLRSHYEVSCAELDAMQELWIEHPQVYGARMMGAGFGGCALVALKPGAYENLFEQIADEYQRRMQRSATIIQVKSGEGAAFFDLQIN